MLKVTQVKPAFFCDLSPESRRSECMLTRKEAVVSIQHFLTFQVPHSKESQAEK